MINAADIRRARPLLDLIGKHEAGGAEKRQRVATPYDVVWGGIKERPPMPITSMTAFEVQAWQAQVVRNGAASSAVGRYQFIRKTLAGLIEAGDVFPSEPFNATAQDRAAIALMDRRGWREFLSGHITAKQFGDNLAREWASFPVHSRQQGQKRTVERGETFYAGDGLNKASANPDDVLRAINATLALPASAGRESPVQSKTVIAEAVQIGTGATAVLGGIGALDGNAQIALIVGGLLVMAIAAFVMRERLKAWAAGWR